MKCPSCGNKGKPDSRPDPGVPAAFAFRGRLGTKVIVRCLRCDRGVFVRMVPPGYKAVLPDQWRELDAFWQMRRGEIIADLQATRTYPVDRPHEEVVAQSQDSFPGTTQNRANMLHSMRQAGYDTPEQMADLTNNRPVEFARIAMTAREQSVIHDGYEGILAQGGAPQTERAAARIAAAKDALAGGEEGIRAFLNNAE